MIGQWQVYADHWGPLLLQEKERVKLERTLFVSNSYLFIYICCTCIHMGIQRVEERGNVAALARYDLQLLKREIKVMLEVWCLDFQESMNQNGISTSLFMPALSGVIKQSSNQNSIMKYNLKRNRFVGELSKKTGVLLFQE